MKQKWYVLIASSIVILLVTGASYLAFREAMRAETNVRYAGLQNFIAVQLSKTIRGMELSAANVFNEVEKHMEFARSCGAGIGRRVELEP